MRNSVALSYRRGMHQEYAAARMEQWKEQKNVANIMSDIERVLKEFRLLIETKQALFEECHNFSIEVEIEDLFTANEAVVDFRKEFLLEHNAKRQIIEVECAKPKVEDNDREEKLKAVQKYEKALEDVEELRLKLLFRKDFKAIRQCEDSKKRFESLLSQALLDLQ